MVVSPRGQRRYREFTQSKEERMADQPEFDVAGAHKYFSAHCFNRTWELLDKPDRTPEEDERMIRLSLASHWHWTQRADCNATNTSVAHWQTSRVYAVLKMADNARRYAHLALAACEAEGILPFCRGYAYEALARAEWVAGNTGETEAAIERAREAAETIPDLDTRKRLLEDLASIE
jgi:hypothetical protein